MQENNSITFEEQASRRIVTKRDGKQEQYDPQILWNYLKSSLSGLNEANFNLDMIVDKVSKGLYNGKCSHAYLPVILPIFRCVK